MPKPTNSFKQFNYSLRPSKQVERKVMIEILLGLSRAGFNVMDYRYLGFGSPYYVDFVMFHKYLFMRRMVCVEWGEVERRMRFNKPFRFIKLELKSMAAHIPNINARQKLLAWLDYDRSLDLEMVRDMGDIATRLAPKSILIITVDARPMLPKDDFPDRDSLSSSGRERLTLGVYRNWFGAYVEGPIEREMVSRFHVSPLFYEVIVERIRRSLAPRELQFLQFFNYFYSDGAPMLTVGGLIGTSEDAQALAQSGVLNHRFVRRGKDYLEISVPPLTMREKNWLDSRLYGKVRSSDLRFELEDELLQNYCRFYKEYPTYLETLL